MTALAFDRRAEGRGPPGTRPQLRCQPQHDFTPHGSDLKARFRQLQSPLARRAADLLLPKPLAPQKIHVGPYDMPEIAHWKNEKEEVVSIRGSKVIDDWLLSV